MQYRKRIYGSLLVLALLAVFSVEKANAQYMPIVYDRIYGDNTNFQHVCPASSGEVVLVGCNDGKTTISWVKRDGEVFFSRSLPDGFTTVNNVHYLGNNKILVLGQSAHWKAKKKTAITGGRAIIIDNAGAVSSDVYMGEDGSELLCGKQLRDGSLILGGYETKMGTTHSGMIGKLDASGKEVYKYVSGESGSCIGFDVLGSSTEYIHVAFTGDENKVASVVRLDNKGKPVFVTRLTDNNFQIQKMLTAADDHIFLIGNSNTTGGRIIKIRTEGDIVFNKEIASSSDKATVDYLYLANNGNILVGGNGSSKSYYSLLRNDGTDLQKYILKGSISGMGLNPVSGESVIVGFDTDLGRGSIIGLAKDGRQIYQKATDGNFDKTQLTPNGIFLASSATGRICMLSNSGDLLFDRYAVEDGRNTFDEVYFTSNGDVLFKGMGNRLIKLGHGLYVSDVRINKPVNGYTTALFTVTLTGYSTTSEGAPVPVTVEYFTKAGTATEANNYTPIKGSLSFVPANDGATHYMIKQEIEVPVKANNLMEGQKMFEVQLANIKQSYPVKPVGIGTIEDHEILVKLVNTEDGVEGLKDVVYELGIFKTNGEPLINSTGSDIVVDGIYGKGTADVLDFDMGIIPRVMITKGSKTGQFNVKTLNDTRYELPKSVVVDFNKIYAINDVSIGFESSLLSSTGTIIDQPAMIAINSLGDHGRMNNIVSGFFRVSLLRASDGVLLTNATGGDVNISCSVSSETTATEGKDFVLTNLHDLRIWGDGNRSAVNLNGIILFDKEKLGAKKLVIGIDSVATPANAPQINIASDGKYGGFMIND
ncbi:Calx-beta domain-containing protein [Dysgonomonas sp. ZJ709]|uniref:Calx-beta domain-containing protein n=1 Tax=Dysgonomonas sp. ZJ709 TaxID=2709797 RepID=UPI0013ECA081|nr:Calx-beta domain-containing protein [Dysgonomonas sp. ZJ709]